MLEHGIDGTWHRHDATSLADHQGMRTAQRMQQHAAHAAALLELPEATGRPADLTAMGHAGFLQPDGQQQGLGLGAVHARRQQRERRGDGRGADLG
ncbi:hypothetical protein ACE0DR_01050 [Azotobacter sp. CWF10]